MVHSGAHTSNVVGQVDAAVVNEAGETITAHPQDAVEIAGRMPEFWELAALSVHRDQQRGQRAKCDAARNDRLPARAKDFP